MRTLILSAILLAAFQTSVYAADLKNCEELLTYPQTKKVEVVDDYHGTQVADPYRWLEESSDTPEVRAWVDEQNKLTTEYLEKLPVREQIKNRLTKLWDYDAVGAPSKEGGRYFYFKRTGLQNQSVLYVAGQLGGEERVLLDPNTLSQDGTVALSSYSVSPDGKLMAYGVSRSGSDWVEWRVKDVETGKDLNDFVQWTKFTGASWSKDGKGFYYSRFPEGDLNSPNFYNKVYFHKLGTAQADDALVFEDNTDKEWMVSGGPTEDGKYLVLYESKGTDNVNNLFYREAKTEDGKPGPLVKLIDTFDAEYSLLANDGDTFFVKTNLNAPRGKIIAIDIKNPARENWKEVIPQAGETIDGVSFVNGMFAVTYLKDAHSQIRLFDKAGKHLRDVDLPGIGSVGGFGGGAHDTEIFYTFTGFTMPTSVYRYNLETGENTLVSRPKVDFNPDDYETKQVFYTSKDGTKVPMFIVHKKGITLDGSNPTYLYGYGGFNISLTPSFSVTTLAWLEMGGVFVEANLRGGGEYGEEWHQAGKREKKQNVFDDFIAAAEWLVANKYTSPSKLGIGGGSNGGLLVGATLLQRPDLFAAAVPAVGVHDMLRYQNFSAGRYWVDEYGSSADPKMFPYLRAYSPVHNVKEGVKYPATLVLTGDHDDRVVPAHSYKFAASLQAAQGGSAPILLRVDTKAGHGAGKPTAKVIEETADKWAFLLNAFGVKK